MTKKTTQITVRTADTIHVFPVFDPVCDFCNSLLEDTPGGGVIGSSGLCPECWKRVDPNEEGATPCPEDVGLQTWIRETYW